MVLLPWLCASSERWLWNQFRREIHILLEAQNLQSENSKHQSRRYRIKTFRKQANMWSYNNERGTDESFSYKKQVGSVRLSKGQMEPVLKARGLCGPISLWRDRNIHSLKNWSFSKDVIHELRERSNGFFCGKGSQGEWEVQDWLKRNIRSVLDECEWRDKIHQEIRVQIQVCLENILGAVFWT